MAKGKTAKTKNDKTATAPKRKAATPKAKAAGRSKSAAKSAAERVEEAAEKAAFSGVTIGHAAGDVWNLLNEKGPQTLTDVKKSLTASSDVILAAVGWLAREDKLEFSTSGKTVKIGLR